MPGTIHVSVMEFKGLPSISTPTFLKVSLGKREYQTSDKGDFFFPLTTLRDNLVVTLLDADGNRIAVAGIQTMTIVEKVTWDEIFPLDDGGHVRLKVQFILNEEEQNRIRLKREAALKKKQESNPNISHTYPEIASTIDSSVTSTPQAEQVVSGKKVMSSLGNCPIEAESYQTKSSSSGYEKKKGTAYEMKKDQKASQSPWKPRSESSSDGASGGLVGQAIKIAIIVGFGVLVLFTRQREPRKSKRDIIHELIFTTSDNMDEQTTTGLAADKGHFC